MRFETGALIFLVFLDAVILAALIVMYHKVTLAISRLSAHTASRIDNSVAQTEALLSLYAELSPSYGFPATRGWAASPDFLRIVSRFVADERPEAVLECSSGISTVVLALALRKQGRGKVYSLEHESEFAERTRMLIKLHGLEDWATVIDAPLQKLTLDNWAGRWYSTSNIPALSFDMLVIDGPPSATAPLARYPAVPVLLGRLKSRALIVLDDADRADERKAIARWEREVEKLERVPYLSAEKGIAVFRTPRYHERRAAA